MKTKDLAKELVKLTVLEINDLSKILKEKYGIEEFPVHNTQINNKKKEKKEIKKKIFDLYLKSSGKSKLATIKLIKNITGKGLKESKDIVDSAPSLIKNNLNKTEADLLIKEFDQIGAIAELK
ncbi:50S ribosomal protein L7/L12 [Candidatus Karelsulcia muelleri]|uniref:ribosomal protein bL12 n=1 Tax=Candidatus Karelsulcia muelleri TaxID=336810 RepID=UPI001FF6ED25|nr:50S ribosomal protein L7/L12 [Candidatus Karelsulcia muelleri]UOQ27737.1 50S ribosomal protein L7/L12 [Candidatus Karelsulcia muelleri]UOQ38163.1 50S ribosomal protein L7/L12 [Candidatus Karelsulcia muelleri]